jgi:tRNA dimethylallyltransferase
VSTGALDFVAIAGPTASGKTDLSLGLAERLAVEVVSMDSRQVYRDMDIGTDKVGTDARNAVPHHGLDLVDPGERYSAGHFGRDARRWIEEIRARGRLPLLVGGTGFFLRSLIEPLFREPELDETRRAALRRYLRSVDPDTLEQFVRRLDPARAEKAVAGGPQRMSRTIEVALLSGVPLSRWHRDAASEAAPLSALVFLLDLPREEMDRRIDDRVSRMLERGLVAEVQDLLDAGHSVESPGMTATGYREIVRYLAGEWTLEEAAEEIRGATRRYARRQLTWFRNQMADAVVRIDATAPLSDQLERALRAMAEAGVVAPGSSAWQLVRMP